MAPPSATPPTTPTTIPTPGPLPADHPLAAPSALPFAMPPFDRIREEHHRPAIEAGLAEHLAEVEAIAADPAPATFENTVEALERAGALLRRATAVFFHLTGSCSTPGLREVERAVAPQLSAHADAVLLHPGLFARLDDLHARRDDLGLDPERRRVLERRHRDAVRAGAGLGAADQERLRALNTRISELTTAFGAELLLETNDSAVLVEDPARLAGLSEAAVAAAARTAAERGRPGGHLLPLVLFTDQPVLASLDDRGLREEVYAASASRGSRGGPHDTRALLVEIAHLRAASLLGAPHHAAHRVAVETAGSTAAVMELLTSLVPAAAANARAEAAELVEELHAAGHEGPLRPWDRAWCAQRLRARRYDLDAEELRAFFPLDRVLEDGVFHAAGELYGLRFTERHDLPVFHEDVRVWEVTGEDGAPVGLFLGDFHARESKRGGAWMNNLVGQSRLLGQLPVVVNTLNVPRPADGEPALLTLDELTTTFHEFGHALHGLLSAAELPLLSGTAVPRDFVEFPSQVNEVWAFEPSVLARYARHHATGEPLDPAVVERLRAAEEFGQGAGTTELLAAMLLDQAWHQLGPDEEVAPEDVESFERAALAAHGLADDEGLPVLPRYRSAYFNHVFAGGYSAGYYAYLWSEVLDADTVEWFRERGGMLRENGAVFARELLSRGGWVDPMQAYRAFRGRDPEIGPLLARRGLVPA